jgi:iron complex transport system ATP-binding protein
MIMVTHHVEEIPAGFTHALLLADGRVSSAGPLEHVITGENLSRTFGLELHVHRDGDRFAARGA